MHFWESWKILRKKIKNYLKKLKISIEITFFVVYNGLENFI